MDSISRANPWHRQIALQAQREAQREIPQPEEPTHEEPTHEEPLLMKQCAGCGEHKSIDAFSRNPHEPYTSRHARCKDCERFAARQKRQIKQEEAVQKRIDASLAIAWAERIEQKSKRQYEISIKRYYGMTMERYTSLLEEQKGVCAICGTAKKQGMRPPLVIDHSHVTGAVRGLLCSNCNLGLGFLQDNIEVMKRAIQYLQSYQWE